MSQNVVCILSGLILLLDITKGLKVTGIEVPRWLLVGQRADLKCHVDLEGEIIYSMTWWKDGGQFFQYIPKNKPPAVVFTMPGIAINPKKSTLYTVQLVDVQRVSTGQYRCEVVAEAPTFTTSSMASNMTIVDAPDNRPIISGNSPAYRDGDIININCTSPKSNPAAELMWYIKGEKVLSEHLLKYDVIRDREESLVFTSILGFTLKAQRNVFPRGFLNLRCVAVIHNYQWHSDVTLHFDTPTMSQPHHLPTQLQTGTASSLKTNYFVVLVIQINIIIILKSLLKFI